MSFGHLRAWIEELSGRLMRLESSGGGGGGSYTGTATVTVGGISSGQSFAAQSLQQMFDDLIAPYAAPAFSSFSISGLAAQLEVGASFGAGVTFLWGTTNSGNVGANNIVLTDTTLGTTIASGLANSGSSAQTLAGGAVTRTTAGTHVFGIAGTNTHAGGFSRSLTVPWLWRMYYGVQAAATLSGAQAVALASSQLASGYAGTFAMGAGGFKYIVLADAVGGQINSVKDLATGFNVPMATSTDNAVFSNVDGGGFSYALVTGTNAQGVATSLRYYRTKNTLGAALTVVAT